MLKVLKEEELDQYVDFAFALTMEQSKSSYPIYTDGIKTKGDFIKAAHQLYQNHNGRVILFIKDEIPMGWIQYFVIKDDYYLQLTGFSMQADTAIAMDEFLKYLRHKYPGYDLYFGFPQSNEAAINSLRKNHFRCIESDYNDTYFLDEYEVSPVAKGIIKVTEENYSHFRALHTPVNSGYWNADRLYQNLEDWQIFLYYHGSIPVGALYMRNKEIYGIDYASGTFDKEIYATLIKAALNSGKNAGWKTITFFNDEESQDAAIKLGFQCVGDYALYIKHI